MRIKSAGNMLAMLFVILSIALPIPAAADDQYDACGSAVLIYADINGCDGLEVALRGKVLNLDFATSIRGNKYTVFRINDTTAEPLSIFSYGWLQISEGDTISVIGNFTKMSNRSGYVFYQQVITSPDDVHVMAEYPEETDSWKLLVPAAIILAVAGALVAYRKYHKTGRKIENHEKGASFEDYMQRLFDQQEWTIVDRTKDLSGKIGRKVESDSNPDFTFRHNATCKTIAVECKYHSAPKLGKTGKYGICWTAGSYQINNYNSFQERTRQPVFAAIGVGGTPSEPKQLFLVPLYRLQYKWADIEYLKKFERNPQKKIGIRELNLA